MLSDKILVVDDENKVIAGVKLAFPEYEVIGIQQGDKAIDYLKGPNAIALVLLDIYMKGVNGLEVLSEVKKNREELPIIIMTAFGSMSIVVEALRNHADDFIEKPFDVIDLRDKVKVLLKKRSISQKGENKNEKVERIKRFIERNYTNVSLDSVSDEVCLSSKYISRMFKNNNSSSFREYKVNLKMDKAKDLLTNSSLTVSEISDKLGYQNPESFMRLFKRRNKITPSQYRTKHSKK